MLVIVSVIFLVGCVTPASMPKASAEEQQEALAFKAKPATGRVYVLNGLQRTLLFDRDYHTAADYFIDGVPVGSLDEGQYFVMDIAPGSYTLSWQQRAPGSAAASPYALSVDDGQVVFLRSIEDMRAMQKWGLLTGGIGMAIAGQSSKPLQFEPCPEVCPGLIPQKTMVLAEPQGIPTVAAPLGSPRPVQMH